MGETLPFLIERMDEQIATKYKPYKWPRLPGEYWRRNVWCSTNGSFSKDVFRMLTSRMPLDKVVLRSHYPYGDPSPSTAFPASLDITDDE